MARAKNTSRAEARKRTRDLTRAEMAAEQEPEDGERRSHGTTATEATSQAHVGAVQVARHSRGRPLIAPDVPDAGSCCGCRSYCCRARLRAGDGLFASAGRRSSRSRALLPVLLRRRRRCSRTSSAGFLATARFVSVRRHARAAHRRTDDHRLPDPGAARRIRPRPRPAVSRTSPLPRFR